MRLQGTNGELIGPNHFIELAEETGLIVPLGRYVIEEACRQLARWRRTGCGALRMAVNVSPRQLLEADFIELIDRAVANAGIRHSDLELEITERQVVEHMAGVEQTLRALSARGVRIAIDDFGTGYSSLAYLMQLSVHKVKIDRAFLAEIPTEPRAERIVTAIIAMAKALGMALTAEGIETPAQQQFLLDAGCEFGQGFGFARPQDARAIEHFLGCWAGYVCRGEGIVQSTAEYTVDLLAQARQAQENRGITGSHAFDLVKSELVSGAYFKNGEVHGQVVGLQSEADLMALVPTADDLADDLGRVYGLGDFELIDFALEEEDGADTLVIRGQEKPWGPTYLQTGLALDTDLDGVGYYRFTEGSVAGAQGILSATGYTGEDGFELYLAPAEAGRVWRALLERGAGEGLVPAGLGARDTLRLEAGMALYGHEIDDTVNPWEAGLGWVIKLEKGDFIGREALVRARGFASLGRLGRALRGASSSLPEMVALPNQPASTRDAASSSAFRQPGDQILPEVVEYLGPLQDNGGPTPTIALLPDSPAVNAGDPAFDPADFAPALGTDRLSEPGR